MKTHPRFFHGTICLSSEAAKTRKIRATLFTFIVIGLSVAVIGLSYFSSLASYIPVSIRNYSWDVAKRLIG